MDINKSNYEAWLLDYFEGTLDANQVGELLLFAEQHPELGIDLEEDLLGADLEAPDALTFEGKSSLKKEEGALITVANYEDFLVAEIEGLLSKEELLVLEAFVKEHPEAAKARAVYAGLTLQPEATAFEAKGALKRHAAIVSITAANCEDFLVAEMEGTLGKEEEIALVAYIKAHPEVVKDQQIYARLKLQPDPSVVFDDKGSLKRKRALVIPMFVRMAAAAAVALLVLFFWPKSPDSSEGSGAIAFEDPTTESVEKESGVLYTDPIKETVSKDAGMGLSDNELAENSVALEGSEPSNREPSLGETPKSSSRSNTNFDEQQYASESPVVPVAKSKEYSDLSRTNPISIAMVPENPKPLGSATVLTPVDSAIHIGTDMMRRATETAVAANDAAAHPEEHLLNVWQYVGMKIKSGLLDQDEVADGTIREKDLAYAVGKGLDKVTKKDVKFKEKQERKRSSYGFQIGKFSFSRSTIKK